MKFNYKKNIKKGLDEGFTLVELMVVIAIIAILAAIAITVFGGQQKNARDSQRRADIDAIANALESQKSTNATYQNISASNFTSQKFPVDPGNTVGAVYSICYNKSTGTSLAANISVANPNSASHLAGWPNTTSGPSGSAGNNGVNANCLSSTGVALVNGSVWPQVDTIVNAAIFTSGAGTFNWAICAKLEGGEPYYCRTNSQ